MIEKCLILENTLGFTIPKQRLKEKIILKIKNTDKGIKEN
jgi:hypothetical protein